MCIASFLHPPPYDIKKVRNGPCYEANIYHSTDKLYPFILFTNSSLIYCLPCAPVFLTDDDALPTAAVTPVKPDRRQRSSQLQDITEEEEEVSSGSSSREQPLPPPLNLELDRQFVEGDGYGVALTWTPPSPLPPHATGYNVYVNGELMSVVQGVEQSSVIISGVPRKQVS